MARWPSRITDPNSPNTSFIIKDGAGMNDGLPIAFPIALPRSTFLTGKGAEKFTGPRIFSCFYKKQFGSTEILDVHPGNPLPPAPNRTTGKELEG